MSYKLKLFIFILPVIVLPLLLMAPVFLINATDTLQGLQLELMTRQMDDLKGRCEKALDRLNPGDLIDEEGRRKRIRAEIIRLAQETFLPGCGLAIIDCRSKTVFAPGKPLKIGTSSLERILSLQEGVLRIDGQSGRQLAVLRSVPQWDWVIAAVAAEDLSLKPARDLWAITIAVTGASILTALGLAWLLIGGLARPLRKLEDRTRKISRGDFEVSLKIDSRDEIGRLAKAFNLMSRRIRELVSDLHREIRKRQELEAALQQSEAQFREMAENIRDVVWLYDWRAKKMLYASPAFETVWGRSLESLYARPAEWVDSIHPDDRPQAVEAFDRIARSGMICQEYRIIRPDGNVRWVSDRGVAVRNDKGEVVRIAGIAEDVTYRVRTLEALMESEGRFATFFNTSPEGLCVIRLRDGRYIAVNDSYLAATGYTREEVVGKTSLEFSIWHDVQDRRRFYRRLQAHKQVDDFEFVFQTRDGTLKTAMVSSKIIPFNNEPHIVAIVRDISQLKHTRDALKATEEKYRLLVDNAIDAIFIIQDGLIQFPNPKTIQLTGYAREELVSRRFIDFVHLQDRRRVQEYLSRPDAPPAAPRSFRMHDKDGRELWVELSTVAVIWEEEPALLNFLRDITVQKKLEEKFQQAQKMEAIGTLAGGIAHDFNNLLMGVHGRASLMMMNLETSHPHREYVQEIQEYVRSATELIRQLLGFARAGKYQVMPCSINDLATKTAAMFGRTRKEIHIHTAFAKPLPLVEADPVQLEQVLLNLYLNAWQAMPQGGEIFIETREYRAGRDFAAIHDVPEGNYVQVMVRDTGMGMDDQTMQRIFDPFFTTKGRGRGTGLGLASAYGIIKNHGGVITVSSEPDKGASFVFYLPASTRAALDAERAPPPPKLTRGTGTILLVDDEVMILEVGRKMLEELGYRVLAATGGDEAVRLYQAHRPEIGLAIIDMVMPDKSGAETFRMLKEIDPGVKVLLASGYSITHQVEEVLASGGRGYIQKPFALETLSARVAELMG